MDAPVSDTRTNPIEERLAAMAELMTEAAGVQDDVEAMMRLAALRALVRVRIADFVAESPRPITEVAADAGADAGALRRLLRYVAPQQWFRVDDDLVSAYPRAALLRRSSPMWAAFAHDGAFDAAHRLDHSLLTGRSAFEHVFGRPFFAHLAENPEHEGLFAETMRDEGTVLNLVAVPHMALGDARTVADIGGGSGDLLATILRANPDMRGVLLDAPGVIANAIPELIDGELSDRTALIAGDLFGPMPTADVYVLARILHDWSDDDAARILRAIRAAAPEGARLFDLDHIMPVGEDPHPARLSDVAMLTLFGGGRERSLEDFRKLLERCGWRLTKVTELPLSSMLEAVAVQS